MNQATDKRRFTRIPFDATATLIQSATARKWKVDLVDISLKGVLLREPEDWEGRTGDHCTLHIRLAGNEVELNMAIEIRHQHDRQVGAVIKHMDLDTASHLHRLVELNIGDEDLLERELAELIKSA